MQFTGTIPANLINFILVTVFSLLIGLSQRRIHSVTNELNHTFGTDRTFTFIGILGFILYIIGGEQQTPSSTFAFGIVYGSYLRSA